MKQSIVLKLFIVLVAVAAVGGAAFVGFNHTNEVRGDTDGPSELTEVYTHTEPGFSFRYPRAFRANEMPQAEGTKLVVVEDPLHDKHGFQVFSMPYDEAEPITPERISQDLPDKVIEDVHPVQVDGVEGLAFTSDDESHNQGLGRLYEIWMVHDGVLYQLATYPELAGELQQVVSTWTFHP